MTQDTKKNQSQTSIISSANLNLILIILIVVFAVVAGYFYSRLSTSDKSTSKKLADKSQTVEDPLQKPADNPKFLQCLNQGKFTSKVKDQASLAMQAGLTETPASVVFDLKTNRRLVIVGALPRTQIKKVLSDFMVGKKIESTKYINPEKVDTKNLPLPSVEKDHWQGNRQARYVLVEYSDFECPFCKNFHLTPKELITKDYPNDLAWVYRHLPLTSIHPQAQIEAEASECAASLAGEDKFWQYADSIFSNSKSNGRSFDKNSLANLASQLDIK